jgi:hypothetical protein
MLLQDRRCGKAGLTLRIGDYGRIVGTDVLLGVAHSSSKGSFRGTGTCSGVVWAAADSSWESLCQAGLLRRSVEPPRWCSHRSPATSQRRP